MMTIDDSALTNLPDDAVRALLALAFGFDLYADPITACRRFVADLVCRFDLAGAAIWRLAADDPTQLRLLEATPACTFRQLPLPVTHHLCAPLRTGSMAVEPATEVELRSILDPDTTAAAVVVYPLDGLGLLMLLTTDAARPSLPVLSGLQLLTGKIVALLQGAESAFAATNAHSAAIDAEYQRDQAQMEAESVYNALPDLLVKFDVRGQLIWANQQAGQVVGKALAEVIGTPAIEFFPEADQSRVAAAIRTGLIEGSSDVEAPILAVGGPRMFHFRAVAIHGANGEPFLLVTGRDISDRVEAMEALIASRNILRSVIENIPMRVYWKDPESRYIGCNEPFARDAGFRSPAELIGLDDHALRWSFAADEMQQSDRELMASGQPQLSCIESRTVADGKTVWLRTSRVPLRNAAGDTVGVLGIYDDITEQLNAEQARVRSESLLRLTLDSTADGILVVGPQGEVLQMNQRFLELWRIPDAIAGSRDDRVLLDFVLEQLADPAAFIHLVASLYRSDEIRFDTVQFRDGRMFERYTKAIRIGDCRARLWSFRDITERCRIEAELQNSRERLDYALQGANDGLWDWNVDTDEVYYSPRWKSMLGYRDEELSGRLETWATLVHPEERDTVLQMAKQYLAGEIDRFEVEFRLAHKDGHWVDVLSRAQLARRADGTVATPRRLVGTHVDISARKRAEEELRRHRLHLEEMVQERTLALSVAKEAAETANRAKSTFLANMSHELRTPMHAIMGLTELAMHRTVDQQQADRLGKVADASKHLLAIINDVLDLSRIEAEKLSLDHQPFTLSQVLARVNTLIGARIADKNLQFAVEIAPGLAETGLIGDPLRLGQILLNLISNAVKFTASGRIRVQVEAEFSAADSVRLRFVVEDTGIGIAQDVQRRLFTAFEQADGSMTRRYGGTGLGLAISKRLVELMGGTIGVDSREGRGSSFRFDVHVGRRRQPAPSVAPLPVPDPESELLRRCAGTRVLLVEDDPVNREVSGSLLERAGLIVDTAVDGIDAVEKVGLTAYALVLMDMQMPKMTGIEATRAIRTLYGQSHPPILAMTANAFEEDRRACLDAGMNDHIPKPVERDVFYGRVLRWLTDPLHDTD